jgi:hypothetical protein
MYIKYTGYFVILITGTIDDATRATGKKFSFRLKGMTPQMRVNIRTKELRAEGAEVVTVSLYL